MKMYECEVLKGFKRERHSSNENAVLSEVLTRRKSYQATFSVFEGDSLAQFLHLFLPTDRSYSTFYVFLVFLKAHEGEEGSE